MVNDAYLVQWLVLNMLCDDWLIMVVDDKWMVGNYKVLVFKI